MFAKIPKRIHFQNGKYAISSMDFNIIPGRVGSFCGGPVPNWLSFVVINVKKNGDKVEYFDMIFPRIQICLDQAGPAASGLIFGQDPLSKEGHYHKDTETPHKNSLCLESYSHKQSRRLEAYRKTFKCASKDQLYPVYRFNYAKYSLERHPCGVHPVFNDIAKDEPMFQTPDEMWLKQYHPFFSINGQPKENFNRISSIYGYRFQSYLWKVCHVYSEIY